jgi:hypothetical protein
MALAEIGPTLNTTYALMIGDSPDTLHFTSQAESETREDIERVVKQMYGGAFADPYCHAVVEITRTVLPPRDGRLFGPAGVTAGP